MAVFIEVTMRQHTQYDNYKYFLYIHFTLNFIKRRNSMNTYLFRNSIVLIGFLLLFISGCSKDSSPTGPNTQNFGDLFPLVQNHAYVYNEYDVDLQNNKISGTDHRGQIVVGPLTSIMGKSVNLVIDSVFYSNGTLQSLDTLYFAKGTDGTINKVTIISNSAIFMPFMAPAAGIGNAYNIFTLDTTVTYQGYSYHQSSKVTGVLNQKENVQVSAGSFSAYRLDITEVDSANIGTQLISSSETKQSYWLVENIGPVKIFQTSSSSGSSNTVDELISKNF